MSETDATAPVHTLTGRHALVTGGSRGIGAAIADDLARMGCAVSIIARDPKSIQAKLEQLAQHTSNVHGASADVTDQSSIVAAVGESVDALGPIDILINNAGGTSSASFEKIGLDGWSDTISLNLTSVFLGCRAVIPTMKERGWGRIVNIASTAGLKGYSYVADYCAAKHGVIGLTRALAMELAGAGITVNAVCPGFTDTDLTRASIERIVAKAGRDPKQAERELTSFNPQGRLVTPEEVAAAVTYFCGPGSDAVTGQALAVAGGEVM